MNMENNEEDFMCKNGIIPINPKDPKYPTLIHKVRKKLPTIYHMEGCWSMMMVLL